MCENTEQKTELERRKRKLPRFTMLEVRLSLPHGHIYVGGQTINCSLTFVNLCEQDGDNGDKGPILFLSWATVQLECVASLSARAAACSRLTISSAAKSLNRKSSMAEIIIFQGQPKLLFCDCTLGPAQNRNVDFSEQLPTDAAPSFDGEAVRIFYRLTIGVQRPNQPVKLVKIPIRVLPLPLASVAYPPVADPSLKRTFSDPFRGSGNPFIEDLERERDAAVSNVQSPEPPSPLFDPPYISSSRTYTINAGIDNTTKLPRQVATLTIDKQIVRIGDAVVGLFDFGRSTVEAAKWSAKLCCEELIPAAPESSSEVVSMGMNVVAQQEELCLHSVVSNLFLPVPPDVTPTFESGIVQLRWRVHFEFTILKSDKRLAEAEQSNDAGGYTSWRLLVPGDGGIIPNAQAQATETLSWDMDVKLIAANPRLLTALHYLPLVNTVTVR